MKYLFLISVAIKIKACSTHVAFFADVSKKGRPKLSANSCMSVNKCEGNEGEREKRQMDRERGREKEREGRDRVKQTFAVLKSTTFLDTRSLLLPTRSLLTFSHAYRSIS